MPTLRSLLSVIFFKTTWSKFFPKVSIKQPITFQKKIDCTALFTDLLTVSIKCPGLDHCMTEVVCFSFGQSRSCHLKKLDLDIWKKALLIN